MSKKKSYIFGNSIIGILILMVIFIIYNAFSQYHKQAKIINANKIKEYRLKDAGYNLFARGNSDFKNTDFRISKTPPKELRFVDKEDDTEIIYVLKN